MAKLPLLLLFLLASSMSVPTANAFSLLLGFIPGDVTLLCAPPLPPPVPPTRGPDKILPILPPSAKEYPAAAVVNYHVLPGVHHKRHLCGLANGTVINTSLKGHGIKVSTQREKDRVWLNGVKVTGWSVYKDPVTSSIVHMLDKPLDPRDAPNTDKVIGLDVFYEEAGDQDSYFQNAGDEYSHRAYAAACYIATHLNLGN